MSKSKASKSSKSHKAPARQAEQRQSGTNRDGKDVGPVPGSATRETVESIVVAIILAFLFRAFVAEAFVIPTGSMAPTLMGQHKDVECPECGYWYQAGASIEIEDAANDQQLLESGHSLSRSVVVAATCPLCRYKQLLDLEEDANMATFSGDRILVSKFIYDFTDPKRWDVIVFKYPFNAKQNFIKRLIGLPGETVLVKRGDIFIKKPGEDEFSIARKPDRKLRAILQLVDDSRYLSKSLVKVGWPTRWQPWAADNSASSDVAEEWATTDDGRSFDVKAIGDRDVWLRYHHIVPIAEDWQQIRAMVKAGEKVQVPEELSPTLITDFYAYNAYTAIDRRDLRSFNPKGSPEELPTSDFDRRSLRPFVTLGLHWVGDLAFEGEVNIQSDVGDLLVQLTKGGVAYVCRINIATGNAALSASDGTPFLATDGTTAQTVTGTTGIRGGGKHTIRYTNVDAELRLSIDGKRIEFNGPTTYAPRDDAQPVTTLDDPGDLAPVGIGACGAAFHVEHLRVWRDVYYIATSSGFHEYPIAIGPRQIRQILNTPSIWEETDLFKSRGTFEYTLEDNQFFPMGDNSPQSSDARMWSEHFFERDLLIGRALLIYWPHPWYRPIPYQPNLKRMRLIH